MRIDIDHTRRQFLKRAAALSAAAPVTSLLPGAASSPASPNERLNLGIIGVAGRGAANLRAVSHENIAVLCDIDRNRLSEAATAHPKATTCEDYRRVLDTKGLDAVVVSTPDHMHAFPVVRALRAGLDVYCEKPLAHSVHEARTIREETAKKRAVTQLGTQIHSGDNYRRVVEAIRSGMIGNVRRVHVWLATSHPSPGTRVLSGEPPQHVNYDAWLGPAPARPFHPSHFHFNWRYWWDFGGGVLADFGCHFMDLPHWALELGAATSVEASGRKEYDGDNQVPSVLRVDYRFAARKLGDGEAPPVHMTWYHGHWSPDFLGFKNGVLFEGDRGMLVADYSRHKAYFGVDGNAEPVRKAPEPWIPASIGHHLEWTEAVKKRGPTTCNFDYSGNLTENVLLGNAAYRCGEKLEWDSTALRATNTRKADRFIKRQYRTGWEL